ncbi:MAG: DUF4097 family beta strand repeat protein [Anaerolineae bacterium]|nr:DUF4097 family beta strand repeat protein [Gemmatimonadaceae bacterium]
MMSPGMRIRLALICLGVFPGVIAAQRRVDERHPISPDASIRLTLVVPMATVRVIGWDRDTLSITGTIGNDDRFDGGLLASRQGAKFYVESQKAFKEKKPAASKPVSLELRVPARSRLWIKGGGADVDIRDVTGSLDVSIVGGRIRVAGTPREVNAEAMDGNIEIVGTIPWLRAKSAAGAVTLNGGGDDVALSSVSGNVVVDEGSITRGRFETVTGDIRYRGTTPRDGSLTFDSHSGAVELLFSPKAQANFDFTTISGSISNEISSARAIAGKDMRRRELGLTLGGGGARIVARTFKGGITLRPR